MLADSVTRISKDAAIAALTAQAVTREPAVADYQAALNKIRDYVDCAPARLVLSRELLNWISKVTPVTRKTVHTYRGADDIGDIDVDAVVALIREATDLGWCLPWLGHDLCALIDGHHYNFAATQEGAT